MPQREVVIIGSVTETKNGKYERTRYHLALYDFIDGERKRIKFDLIIEADGTTSTAPYQLEEEKNG